jgi:hypothetical protein
MTSATKNVQSPFAADNLGAPPSFSMLTETPLSLGILPSAMGVSCFALCQGNKTSMLQTF